MINLGMHVRPEFHRLREDFFRRRIRGAAVTNNVHDPDLALAPKLNVDLRLDPNMCSLRMNLMIICP